MIHNFQRIKETPVTTALNGLLTMRAPFTGQISALNIWLGGAQAEAGAILNVSINGTPQYSGASRLILASGAVSGSKTGMALAVNAGDLIQVNVEAINPSGMTPIIEVDLAFDDLVVASGLTTENVQDIVAAMMISGSNSSWVYDDAAGTLKVDAPTLTDEQVQDKVAAFLAGGGATSVTYNDAGNTLTVSSTDNNRTDEEIQDIVAALLAAGTNVSLTYDDAGNVLTVAASSGGGGGSASDATISITDITTNNVSITKHGFTPKLPNDIKKYLNGAGDYVTPLSGYDISDYATRRTFSKVTGTLSEFMDLVMTAIADLTSAPPFSDSFTGTVIDTTKWGVTQSADITISQNEKLIFSADNSYSGAANTALLVSIPRPNFVGKSIQWDLVDTDLGATSGGSGLKLQLDGSDSNSIQVLRDYGTLIFDVRVGGVLTRSTMPYVSTITKLKLEHSNVDNKWRFYTYSGSTWTLQFTSAAITVWSPTAMQITIMAYTYAEQGVTASIDNLISTASY